MCERLNKSKGPTAVIIPVKGFSIYSREGGPLFDHEADMAFASMLKKGLKSNVRYIEVDNHINDPEFLDVVTKVFFEISQNKK